MSRVLALSAAASRGLRPGLLARLLGALALRRSRRRLLDLDDRLLRDVGLTAAQARAEAARPEPAPWAAPGHWLR